MDRRAVKKIVRGALRRIVNRTRIRVLRAHCQAAEVVCPSGFALIRITRDSAAAYQERIESAMMRAGEPRTLVAERFAHGDEFFAWRAVDDIVSFGWVCYRDREVGPIRLSEAPGRAFLFNFHTTLAYRARGLYSALLVAIQSVLGNEGYAELIIDVNVSNTVSARAIEQVRFVPVGLISFTTFLGRWRCVAVQVALDLSGSLPW